MDGIKAHVPEMKESGRRDKKRTKGLEGNTKGGARHTYLMLFAVH